MAWDYEAEGNSYRPFLHIRDVPSLGRETMVLGLKSNRIHHLMSDLEYFYFLLCEFLLHVVDIREQFALVPWELPQAIARGFSFTYPRYFGTKIPYVMTSDFVLTVLLPDGTQREIVLSVKPAKALNSKDPKYNSTIRSPTIEREYWLRLGVEWHLCADRMLPMTKIRNLEFTRSAMMSKELDYLNLLIPEFATGLINKWTANKFASLNDLLRHSALSLNLSLSNSFVLFGRAVWTHILPLNLSGSVLHHESPIDIVFP
jgi:hypothetical protein